eukprot:Platyproteum_vivax@DN1162_c0_g1_i1.p1
MRAAFNTLDELAVPNQFQRYIQNVPGVDSNDEDVLRLIVCSGQVYYDFAAYREKHQLRNVAIARVEQLSPFPFDLFIDDVHRYPNLQDIVWAQEEPMNAGPWPYVSQRIMSSLAAMGNPNRIARAIYVGRDVGAATAVGDPKCHQSELNTILHNGFDLERKTNSYYEKYLSAEDQELPSFRSVDDK